MKKLSIMIMFLMWFNMISSGVFAAADDDADMAALQALLNEEDTGSTTDSWADTTGAEDTATTEDTTGAEDTATTEEKVVLEVTSNPTDSVVLLLHPVEGYTTYKVYYNKEGDDNVNEKEVIYTGAGVTSVELKDLEPSTTYIAVAKAFDEDGNPIESTTSDPVTFTTQEPVQHAAPADNVIYNPTVKVYDDKIVVTYKPGMDVKKIQISMSDDGQTFKPVAVVDASTTTYTIPVTTPGKKYIKLVPVAEDGTLWVCKIWATDVQFVTAEVKKPTKTAEKNVGKAKTGPETYFLIILAVLAYIVYARRKMKA